MPEGACVGTASADIPSFVNTSPSPPRRQWWLRPWVWMLLLLLGGIGWDGWREYDFQRAVREAEAAGFSFTQSPGPVAFIRADWHAAFRANTWSAGCMRYLVLPSGCDLAQHQTLLLRLHPTRLTAYGCRNVSAIRGLTGLDTLDLTGSDMKDFAPLAGLSRLEYLNLSDSTAVVDLAPLAGLKQLLALELSRCKGVADLAPLAGLAQLQSLDLYGCTGLSAEAVAAFRKSHPKTGIYNR